MKNKTHRFQLVATVQRECCQGSHLWFQSVAARTPKMAGAKLARIIQKSGAVVYEIAEVSNQEWVWELHGGNF
jgi:hypothetical protein